MEFARAAGTLRELATVCWAVVAELYERERSHTASLGGELEASLELGLRARITALDLKRVVSNLIENARRYGRSSDGMAHLVMTLQAEGGMIVIEVADRGPGIAPELRGQVLQPYVRLDPGSPGFGLGLALVQVVADKHGGHVEVTDSDLGGACIRLHLPLETGGVVEGDTAC
ncbi:hypothetical protein G6F31_018207 [Rhizopus arrhizus]|nr:hypothetical protein G6F31_018207 [Rhizopus arrhizus]